MFQVCAAGILFLADFFSQYGKTIRYRHIALNKYTPKVWKKFVAEFVVTKPAYYIQFYIKSQYFSSGDKVLLKEPFIKIIAKK